MNLVVIHPTAQVDLSVVPANARQSIVEQLAHSCCFVLNSRSNRNRLVLESWDRNSMLFYAQADGAHYYTIESGTRVIIDIANFEYALSFRHGYNDDMRYLMERGQTFELGSVDRDLCRIDGWMLPPAIVLPDTCRREPTPLRRLGSADTTAYSTPFRPWHGRFGTL